MPAKNMLAKKLLTIQYHCCNILNHAKTLPVENLYRK